MANIQINIIENGKTTLATQGCICDRNIDINVAVPETGTAECDKIHLPESALNFGNGDCKYTFYSNNWNWFIRECGDKIATSNIVNSQYMFGYNNALEEIPFDLNFNDGSMPSANSYNEIDYMFYECKKLKSIGTIRNLKPNTVYCLFYQCNNLRYLPTFENLDMSYINSGISSYTGCSGAFQGCFSLREIPEDVLKKFYRTNGAPARQVHHSLFTNCYALDEIRGINPTTADNTSNFFVNTFDNCMRLKNVLFLTNEDGTPMTAQWKNQVIDLTKNVGRISNASYIKNYNSGITADKEVYDDASYQALKNDPDWWTTQIAYSRYNHDSAVATINSLPDCSAYDSGATNIIKFTGASGELTDGGAINTLTEEEIAVATAKGWTVQIV